jgi:hypothetical protein
MVIKLFAQLVWEAAILPVIRFIIGYIPMIVGVFIAMEDTIKYFLSSMVQYGLLEWLVWYIPAILLISLTFGVMASNVKKIHPIAMAMMLITSLFIMNIGASGIKLSLFYNETPTALDAVTASVSAVTAFYCIALMCQRAWVEILPKRKK